MVSWKDFLEHTIKKIIFTSFGGSYLTLGTPRLVGRILVNLGFWNQRQQLIFNIPRVDSLQSDLVFTAGGRSLASGWDAVQRLETSYSSRKNDVRLQRV